jgi:hypothetical protein
MDEHSESKDPDNESTLRGLEDPISDKKRGKYFKSSKTLVGESIDEAGPKSVPSQKPPGGNLNVALLLPLVPSP